MGTVERAGEVVSGGIKVAERFSFVAPLATRIVIGLTYFQTGMGKLEHLDRTAQFFASSGIPFPHGNALLVGALELVGGPLLVAGLGTRLASLALGGSMAVAILTADRAAFVAAWKPGGDSGPTDVASFVFLLFLLWLLFMGPGTLSVDHWLKKRLSKAAP